MTTLAERAFTGAMYVLVIGAPFLWGAFQL